MHLVIFEDSHWPAFAPFSLSRPVFSLLSGMTTLLARQIRQQRPSRLTLWVRPELEEFCRQRIAPTTGVPTAVNVPLDDEPAMLMNARLLRLSTSRLAIGAEASLAVGELVAAASIRLPGLRPADPLTNTARWQALIKLSGAASDDLLLQSPVDLIYANEQALLDDFAELDDPGRPSDGPYHFVNESQIRVGHDAVLSPGCVLDASKGPIVIAERAAIGANAVIQGPCWIGPGSTVAPLANIRGGVSIGPQCKVGGEISATIFLGFSNKSHEGFVGHSYIGEWVNLGAGTTTSNLKNTYGAISLKIGSREIPTGRRFLGALIGDHAKTAILTRLMGGTYVGYNAMLAGSTAAPRFVRSFAFLTDKGGETYVRDKAIEVAQRVLARRERTWTEMDQQVLDYAAQAAARVEA